MDVSSVLLFISIFVSAIHTGSQFSLSFVSANALLAAPNADEATILAQFRIIFRKGFVLCPPSALISTLASLANAIISWWFNDNSKLALRFLLAACTTAALVPFSLTFIIRSESLLMEKSAKAAATTSSTSEKPKEIKIPMTAETRDLISEWARLNYIRTLFPLIGALISFSAY